MPPLPVDTPKQALRVASLFSGIGGAEIGFAKAFPNIEHVAFCEWDKFASQVLAARFPGVPNFQDVTKVDWEKLPKCDILHASPPCQAFSVAGKQKGMDDERGMPMWEAYFKCLEAVRPPIITLEEVPAVASKKFQKEWEWIQSEWARLGYHVKWTKIQALDHGVPQSRNRLIVVGFLDKWQCDRFEWPTPQPRTLKLKDILQPEDEVDVKYYLKGEQVMKLLAKMTDEQITRLMSISAQTINPMTGVAIDNSRSIRTGGGASMTDKHNHDTIGIVIDRGTIRPTTDQVATALGANDHRGFDNHGQRTGVAMIVPAEIHRNGTLTEREVCPTLRAQSKSGDDEPRICVINKGESSAKHPYIVVQSQEGKPYVVIGDKALTIRKLTPIECCRLMSWPDGWNECVSNSQRYRQCGNGVVSNVIEAVANQINQTL